MHGPRVLIGALLAAAGLSCASPEEPEPVETVPAPVSESWTITFQQLAYNAPGKAPVADSATVAGTLHHKKDDNTWILQASGGPYLTVYSTDKADSTRIIVRLPDAPWASVGFRRTAFGASFAGTYTWVTSPHGTYYSGTFTGKPQ